MEDFLKQKATSPLPTATHSVGSVPTIIPGDRPVFQNVHDTGKRTLWVLVVLMGISSLCFYVLAARIQVQKRLFHVLTALITTISFLSYLAMATGEGITWRHSVVHGVHDHVPDTRQECLRQVFWVRYLNWMLTNPLLVLNIGLVAGLNGANILVAVSADLIMFVAGLAATFARHERRWVWYAISCISYLTLVYQIGFNGHQAVLNRTQQTRTFFGSFSGAVLLVLALYPIILAASPLAHRISVDSEVVVWAILDILTQGIFGFWLLFNHDNRESSQLYVDGFWAHGHGHEGAIRVGDAEGA